MGGVMTGRRQVHGVTVVGIGPSGRAASDFLLPWAPSSHSHVAVARSRRALADGNADVKILLRPGDLSEDVMALRWALEGAELVIIAGSTDEGITPLILDAVKAQGSAVARVVDGFAVNEFHLEIPHMVNDILAENAAWIIGDRKGRAAPRDIPPPSVNLMGHWLRNCG